MIILLNQPQHKRIQHPSLDLLHRQIFVPMFLSILFFWLIRLLENQQISHPLQDNIHLIARFLMLIDIFSFPKGFKVQMFHYIIELILIFYKFIYDVTTEELFYQFYLVIRSIAGVRIYQLGDDLILLLGTVVF